MLHMQLIHSTFHLLNAEPIVMSDIGGNNDIGGDDEFTDRRARILKKLADKQLEKVKFNIFLNCSVFVSSLLCPEFFLELYS